MDKSVQNFSSFESYVRINDDELEIYNKMPINNPKYVPDKNILDRNTIKEDFLLDDIEIAEDSNYRLVKSSSSCRLEDI